MRVCPYLFYRDINCKFSNVANYPIKLRGSSITLGQIRAKGTDSKEKQKLAGGGLPSNSYTRTGGKKEAFADN